MYFYFYTSVNLLYYRYYVLPILYNVQYDGYSISLSRKFSVPSNNNSVIINHINTIIFVLWSSNTVYLLYHCVCVQYNNDYGVLIAVKSTVSKLHKPLITCLCNLHKCTSNTINGKDGKDGTCTTRLGCFSEIRSVLPPVEETSKPTNATPTQPPMTDNGSAVLPNIPEAFDAETTAHVEGPSSTRASYGCLELYDNYAWVILL